MKILVVLTSHDQLGTTGRSTGFYLSELTHALEVFEEAGASIDLASPRGGRPPIDAPDRNDPTNASFLDDAGWMSRLDTTLRLADVDPSRYDAVYVAGGHGTVFDLPDDAEVQRVLASIHDRGGVVSAVCHGPAALVNVRLANGRLLVDGRDVAGFSNAEEEAVGLTTVVPFLLESTLVARGGRYTRAPLWQPHVVASDRLVTGQNPASARLVASEVVRMVGAAR